jgi:hypothetical protein
MGAVHSSGSTLNHLLTHAPSPLTMSARLFHSLVSFASTAFARLLDEYPVQESAVGQSVGPFEET